MTKNIGVKPGNNDSLTLFQIEKMPRDITHKQSKMEPSSSLLGKGSFGSVYRQGDSAIKAIFIDDSSVDNWEEIDILTRLSHPALCTARDVSLSKQQLKITMPLADCHLKQYVKDRQPSLQNLLCIWRDLLSGLSYLHLSGYLHLDIKPANILIKDDRAMLADFGLAKAMFPGWERASSFPRITYTYRPPENFTIDEYDVWSDIWSLGMTMLVTLNEGKEILTSGCSKKQVQKFTEGCFGTPAARKRTILFYLNRSFPDVDEETKNQVVSLLSSMLDTDHHSRASARALLSNPVFSHLSSHSPSQRPQPAPLFQLDHIKFCSKSHGRALYCLLRRVLSKGVVRIRTFVSAVQLYYTLVTKVVQQSQRRPHKLSEFIHEKDSEKRFQLLFEIAFVCYSIQESIHEGIKVVNQNSIQPVVESFLCQHLCINESQGLTLALDPGLEYAFCTPCFDTLWKRFLHLFSPRYFEKLTSKHCTGKHHLDTIRDDGSLPTMKMRYSLNSLFFHKDAEPYKKRLQSLA
jgi:serine/threonine protein kinase